MGLDDPLPEQYMRWLLALLGGDMGIAVCRAQQGIGDEACKNADEAPIIAEFARRAPATIQLALMAAGIAIVVGIPIGSLAGHSAGSRVVDAFEPGDRRDWDGCSRFRAGNSVCLSILGL